MHDIRLIENTLAGVRAPAVGASLRIMAREMRAMFGPWPSPEQISRVSTLEIAALYLQRNVTRPRDKTAIRSKSVAAYRRKRKLKDARE